MGKISFLNPDNDEKILAGRIEDLALLAEKGRAGFSNFLNIRQREIAAAALSGFDCKVLYYGGFHDAERSVLGLSPSFRELEEWDFPIEAVTFKWNKSFSLSHRDILGTLMSLGIERWAFGDILMDEGKATVFLLKSISENVVREVTKIGNVGVSGEISRKEEIEVKINTLECVGIAASLRLDAIVSELTDKSRSESVKLINSGKIFVNEKEALHSDLKIAQNDIISIRHFGKFKILSQNGVTSKGRIRFSYLKYI